MTISKDKTASNPFKFRMCVPGIGTAEAHTVTELRLDSASFAEFVEAAVSNGRSSGCIWLDILSPTVTDILSLSRIFAMDSNTVRALLGNASVDKLHGTVSAIAEPLPACHTADGAMYLCWAETGVAPDTIDQFLRCREMQPGDTTGGITSVPLWMTAAAAMGSYGHTNGPSTAGCQGWRRSKPIPADIERENRIRRLYRVLDRPKPSRTARIHATVKRWGSQGDRWSRALRCSEGVCSSASTVAGETRLYVAEPVFGSNIVQVWVRGPILLTFHQHTSPAIDNVMGVMAHAKFRTASAERIVQSLIKCWLHAVSEILPVLTRFASSLDTQLLKPFSAQIFECAQWMPILVRCRKAVLELMRRSQSDNLVLTQLCRQLDTYNGRYTSEPIKYHQPKSTMLLIRHLSKLLSMDMEADIDRQSATAQLYPATSHSQIYRCEVLRLHCQYAKAICQGFKETEARFARLHRMLLDRQCRRLLAAEHRIHTRLRTLSFAEVLYWPLDTALGLLRLNGITTIGRLSSDRGNKKEFYYVLLVFIGYIVIAVVIRVYRSKRAGARAAALREAKRQVVYRCKHTRPRLATLRQTQQEILRATLSH